LALEQAQQMVIAGADFLDVGAESSRLGAIKVSQKESKTVCSR
jgi:dihydropteroate synthase